MEAGYSSEKLGASPIYTASQPRRLLISWQYCFDNALVL
jgi:hypothetical protein